MIRNMSFLLSIFLVCGCVHRQASFDEIELTVSCSLKYQIQSKSAEISAIDTINNSVRYIIKFDRVKGGDSKLLGLITITEGHGYKAKRLVMLDENVIVSKLSINDITNSLEQLNDINLDEFIK